MPGQPEGEFDVTKLEAIETEPSGEKHPSFIFDIGENFQLEATFEGAGDTWRNLEFSGEYEAVAQFYAEGMGPGVPDQNFGTKAKDLTWPSPGEYKILSDTVSISRQGIYRCGVVVYLRDRDPPRRPWIGFVGFNGDCVLQVHPFEEFG
jgi:hypothetical protein